MVTSLSCLLSFRILFKSSSLVNLFFEYQLSLIKLSLLTTLEIMNFYQYQSSFSNRSNEQIINEKLEDFQNYIHRNRVHFMDHGKRSHYKSSHLTKWQPIQEESQQHKINVKNRVFDSELLKKGVRQKDKQSVTMNYEQTTKNYRNNILKKQSMSKKLSSSIDKNKQNVTKQQGYQILPQSIKEAQKNKNSDKATNKIKFEEIQKYFRGFDSELTKKFEALTQKIVKLQYKVAMYQRHFNAIQLQLKFKIKKIKNSQIENQYIHELNQDLQERMKKFKFQYIEAQEQLGISKLIEQIQKVKQRLKGYQSPADIIRSPTFDCNEYIKAQSQDSEFKMNNLIIQQHQQVLQSFKSIEDFIGQIIAGQPLESAMQIQTLKFKLENSLLMLNDFLSLKIEKQYPREVHHWIQKIVMQNIQLKTRISLIKLQRINSEN